MKTATLPPFFLVFDVESIGIHGEGFSVGYVVVGTRENCVVSEGQMACHYGMAEGVRADREWVEQNVSVPGEYDCDGTLELRNKFWKVWMEWKDRGAVLLADCAWPVEARFLIACVNDERETRNWNGPYPLHDLASMLLMIGADPLETVERLPNEVPAHNPLNDARLSARQLLGCLAVRPL